MSLKFFEKLSQNFIEFLNDKDDYDVIIEVENKEKTFTAHSHVLKCRSPYFRRELKNIHPNEKNIMMINKSSISAQIFDVILQKGKMSLKFFEKLSQNFIEFLNDKDDYDVIIEVENKEKTFTAHSHVLKCRSPYFRRELKNIHPNEKNIMMINKSSISAQIFDVILQYIYGGIVNLENIESRFIFDLMLIANDFEFEELANKLEILLIETKGSWLKTHFSLIYHSIFSNTNFKKLEKFCNDIVTKYPNLIFDADDFISLQESALVSLLKRDDLQMKEVKIWDYVIKWGIAQNPTLPSNPKEWTKENYITLKTTLQQCLPNVRYFHLSGAEVLDAIKPYKKILDKQLWEDINQNFLDPDRPIRSIILPARTTLVTELPPRTKEPFSAIISEEHASEISSWIDRKTTTYSSTNNPYEFQLILQGTRDGFAPQTFWNMCHGHAGTVIIVKIKGTDEIIGSYNPLMWDNTTNGGWRETKDSFIFSLKNGNIQNSILSRVKNSQNAVYYRDKNEQINNGPYFNDFYMYSSKSNFTLDNGCYCYCNNYEKPIRTSGYFSIVNYEVFKSSWLKTHFSFIYHSVFSNTNFKKLENFCNDIVAKYPNLIFDADDFTSLQESALVSLLKRDDLQMKEVKIWDYVIKWGIAQNPTLPSNPKEWTKENYITLKTTLQQCLPHVRYFHLSSTEVLDVIKPYKKILDKQLWEDIIEYSLDPDRPVKSIILPARTISVTELPPRTKEPFSAIISEEHASEISSWIDRKTTIYSSTNNPYEFQLILQGTRDGFAPQTFWNMCHGHAGTVVIVKIKGTDEIIGGYNPLMWDNTTNGDWRETKDSFIFSLKNANIQNSILSRVKDYQYAVFYRNKNEQINYGPYFNDFYMNSPKSNFTLDNGCYCSCSYYEKPIRTSGYFSIVNYEVFKVKKTI
ncbi:hypothetical protein Glove_242g88 [Diversispora epigaea]|uniref:BTB domain-containing protein n=1 Tax=Diversispora epigaea TaxID=1348612 RepID=A0A397IFC7_9GLOM|nr:hypothetical protein Glove_242g88 [Diversispora epigaea]